MGADHARGARKPANLRVAMKTVESNSRGFVPTGNDSPALEELAARKIQRAGQINGLRPAKGLEATAAAVNDGRSRLLMDEFENVVHANPKPCIALSARH